MSARTGSQRRPDSALRGGVWTTVSRVVTQIIHFAIFMVAVRVMSPEEFGVFALVAAFTVVLNQFATFGWPEYIMQWKGDDIRPRQTLFVAMSCGAILTVLGVGLGFLAPRVTDAAVVAPLLQILSLCIFFTSAGAAFAGVMNWQNRLSAAAITSLVAELANLVVAVWALLEGYGVLALAYGRLASTIFWSAGGLLVTRATPIILTQLEPFREMVLFSSQLIASQLLSTLRVYAATFIIGGFMGAVAVGYYRAAQRIIVAFEEIASEPTRILGWSLFRRVRDELGGTSGFDALSREFFSVLLYGTVPLFIGIAIMAEDLALGVLGPDWAAAVPVLRILAIAAVIKASIHATMPILSLAGRVRLMPRIVLLYSVITIALISAAAPFGLVATALSDVVASLVIFAINAWVVKRYADIDWLAIFRRSWPLLPALLLALLAQTQISRLELVDQLPTLARFILLGLSMMMVFVPVVLALDPLLRHRLSRSQTHQS